MKYTEKKDADRCDKQSDIFGSLILLPGETNIVHDELGA